MQKLKYVLVALVAVAAAAAAAVHEVEEQREDVVQEFVSGTQVGAAKMQMDMHGVTGWFVKYHNDPNRGIFCFSRYPVAARIRLAFYKCN